MNKTDDYVKIKFFYWHEGEEAERIESMWAIHIGENYKIENIPFYVQEYALGDIIKVNEKDGQLYAEELVEESGHSTVQIVFLDENIIGETRDELKSFGCSSEISDKTFLIALDIPPEISYHGVIRPYLEKGCNTGLWDYQEACIATIQKE